MAKVTNGSLWGVRSVENLKIVLRVESFNNFFFFFFFDGWLGRGCFVFGRVLVEWLYF